MLEKDIYKAILFGVAIGDALGVPVEFESRIVLRERPVTDMIGFGTYNVPAGTFSDDSSLTFCLAETLTTSFDINIVAQNFVKWYRENYWTATGEVFDIGIATEEAIIRLENGIKPDLAGGFEDGSNGNGSLMRILPLLSYIVDKPINERYQIIKQVSSITHGHIRSVISCFYFLEFAKQIVEGKNKLEIYKALQTEVTEFLVSLFINPIEIELFDRLLKQNIHLFNGEEILSTGYVLHTLEASVWCLMTTDNYKDAVLKAINLGEDTDTTGAVTGGLAALLYGYENIPEQWIKQLARQSDILDLAKRMFDYQASKTL